MGRAPLCLHVWILLGDSGGQLRDLARSVSHRVQVGDEGRKGGRSLMNGEKMEASSEGRRQESRKDTQM